MCLHPHPLVSEQFSTYLKWFERGVKEDIDVQVENPSFNRGEGLRRNLSPIFHAALSRDHTCIREATPTTQFRRTSDC